MTAAMLVLEPVFEADLPSEQYAYRPKRSAHEAVSEVGELLHRGYTDVVDADLSDYFDQVSHTHLVRFLQHRIADPCLLRIIQRLLKAGVMEDGVVRASEEGTPQGGLASPVLANIYLHYVLDLWFEKRFARRCRGKAFVVRYCADFIACFQAETDARRFLVELQQRLSDFELEVEPTKTRLLRFGSADQINQKHRR